MMLREMLRCDRERLGLSIGQAAVRCRMSPRLLHQLEEGQAKITRYEVWAALRDLYGWPTQYVDRGRSASS
jgi:predicted transcriptional regulator